MIALALAVVIAAAGCSGSEETRSTVEISDARLAAPDTLTLTVQSCNGDPEVTLLTQDDAEVGVQVTSTVMNPGDGCQDTVEVVLDAPFGTRLLVDLQHPVPEPVDVAATGM